jgi:uncharacterized BrkB/YihY/UPF0761 family membrane protein
MTKELKKVVWQWLPGMVAGIIPLLIFLAVSMNKGLGYTDEISRTFEGYRFWDGLVGHLLVFGIVTSSVSTFTAFPRVFAKRTEDSAIGDASLGLVMCITLVLIFSVVMYVMQEAREVGTAIGWGALLVAALLVVAAAIASFYMEMTIANLRFKGSFTTAR